MTGAPQQGPARLPAPQPPDLGPILEAIRRDALAERVGTWGTSTVVDEHTGTAVIDRQVFDALHEAAGVPARFPIGNAGLLHVYGYWFSTTATPYGFKRDRWVDGHLATALGRDARTFHLDHDPATTLLQRVTDAVQPVLLSPSADASVTAEARVGDLVTRVVLHRAASASATALVYGVDDGSGMRLITAFPVSGDPRPVLDEFTAEPRLRWNAAVRRIP